MLIGVDVGTTQTKAGLFTRDGQVVAAAAQRYPLAFDAATGAAEQNPADWWMAVQRTLRDVLDGIPPAELLAIAVGGQGPTVVGMDATLAPVGPALTWMDRRATEQVRQLSDQLGHALPPHAYLARVIWLATERPAVHAATRWYCQAWDFVAAQLCGSSVVSMASAIAPWDDTQLMASGLDVAKFPAMQPMGKQVGKVVAEAARATGLPEGLPVVGGGSDYYGNVIGSNALQPGVACDNGGTSQSLNVCWDAALDVQGAFCLPSFVAGRWYVGGPASTSGRAFDWWREMFGRDGDDDTVLNGAADVPPGSGELVFLPYLAGERAPLWDPDARGVFFGLTLEHGRNHMTRAVMESVAYILCHLIERIEAAGGAVNEIHACGGQARSALWNQIKADATGRLVVVPEVIDAAMLGSAVIAGVGVGAFTDFESGAQQMVRTRAKYAPDPANHAHYRSLFKIYRDLYPALQPLFHRVSLLAAK